MFPQPFQYLQLKDLPEVFALFATYWLIFGLPSLLAILVVSCPIERFKVYRLGIFKHLRFRFVALSLPLIGLLFGMSTGYFEAWTYRFDAESRPTDRWYLVLGIPGVPGDNMANSYGGDWQDDEAWDYRSDIAIWNGLFWTSVTTAGVLVIRLLTRRWPAPASAGAQPVI